MSEPVITTTPTDHSWKPSVKLEALAWLANLETQIGSAMTEEDNQTNAKLDVALQIVGKVETLVNSP